MLQRSAWSCLLVSAAVVSACWLTGTRQTMAQEAAPAPAAPAAAAPAAPAPAAPAPDAAPAAPAASPAAPAASPTSETATAPTVSGPLKNLVSDFLHYSLVNNVELVKANGQAILNANADPKDLIQAFEEAAKERNADPLEFARTVLTRNLRRDEVKDISRQVLDKLEEGYRAVARDPARIRQDIDRLANGQRAYSNASEHLMAAGQFAAPIYFEYLQDGSKKNLYPFILRVMAATGRPLVLPLVDELQVPDAGVRTTLVNLLGQIGYKQALPALKAMQADEKTDPELKKAVDAAIALIDRTGSAASASPTALYLDAAESYYGAKPSYQPLLADEKTNPVWIYDSGLKNVSAQPVPTAVWDSVMARRSARSAIELDSNNGKAISLWLAAELRKEIQLPQGATDPTWDGSKGDGAFYALAAGPLYVNPMLSRALDAHDGPLALQAIDVLEQTAGRDGLVSSSSGSPLVRALSYPDRLVRFRAAFALAKANPEKTFPSHFRVVPILAEAVNSTGAPAALVVSADDDKRNKMAETLRNGSSHFVVYAGSSLAAALEQARRAPAFDVVVVANGADVSHIADVGRSDYRLSNVPVLVTAPEASMASVKAQLGDMKGYEPLNETADDAAINAALTTARGQTGNAPLEADKASQLAGTAIKLLANLAADHKSIYNVTDAVPTLVDALKDKRPDIATGSAGVLGEINNADAQKALAAAATSADADPAAKAAFYTALAASARQEQGNVLDSGTINALLKALMAEQDPATRKAIATALGALNVPSNQASTLILKAK